MKKMICFLLLVFLNGCATHEATERQPNSALALLSSTPAYADGNNILYSCGTNDMNVIKHFFPNSKPPVGVIEGTKMRMIIGQDKSETSPLFEMRVSFTDENNKQMSPPKNYKRLAYVENAETGRVAISYSPSQTFSNQGARAFNLLLDTDNTGKLAFLQQNANGAPNQSIQLACTKTTEYSRSAKPVDLSNMTNDQKVQTIREIRRSITPHYYSLDEDNYVAPKFVNSEVEANVKAAIAKLNMTSEDVRRKIYGGKESQVDLEDAAKRCTTFKWEDYRVIHDFSGQILAYEASVNCDDVALTTTEKALNGKTETEKFSLNYDTFYISGNEVLVDPIRTTYDFARISN